jgi:hypothetical protein
MVISSYACSTGINRIDIPVIVGATSRAITAIPAVIALLLPLVFEAMNTSVAIAQVNYPLPACTPIARVLDSRDAAIPIGYRLCTDKWPSIRSPIRVVCSSGESALWIRTEKDLALCNGRQVNLQRCATDTPQPCERYRAEMQHKPAIQLPAGNTLINIPGYIEWLSIEGATSYELSVWADSTQLTKVNTARNNTKIRLPVKQTQNEQVLQVIVRAFTNNRESSTATKTFMLLSKSDINELSLMQARIKAMPGSNLEKSTLITALLRSYALTDEAAKYLNKQIATRPESKLHRLLADTYFTVGQIKLAELHYIKAQKLAKASLDEDEIELASKGLRSVALYHQAPTNTVPAQ